jgi:hypothetical protein
LSKLEVIGGVAQNVPAMAGRYGFSFDLGEPPVSVSMSAFGGPTPFDSGEYIAIAAIVPGVGGGTLSALAYRRVGQRASARTANPLYFLTGAGLGLLGLAIVVLLVFFPDSSDGDLSAPWTMAVLLACVGTYCAYRLRLMFAARRLLDDWVPP